MECSTNCSNQRPPPTPHRVEPAIPDAVPWDAHLCIEWQGDKGRSGVLDLDLARYSRPEHGIEARPISKAWPEGSTSHMWASIDDVTFVSWRAERHLTNFKKSESWRTAARLDWIGDWVGAVKQHAAETSVESMDEDHQRLAPGS